MFFDKIKDLSKEQFKRLTGIKKITFQLMLDILKISKIFVRIVGFKIYSHN